MKRDWSAVRAVLFDWDGTLVDSSQASVRAYAEMFAALGIRWRRGDMERHYSPDWHRVYRAAGLRKSRWKEADELWRRAYARQRPALLPGARRALNRLGRRYALALVTSGSRERVSAELARFHLASAFAVRVCGEDAARRKPHPAPLLLAMRRLRLPAEACLYAGDAPEDVAMARRAGVRVVAIRSAFSTERRLRAAHPEALLRSIEELPRWLEARRGPTINAGEPAVSPRSKKRQTKP